MKAILILSIIILLSVSIVTAENVCYNELDQPFCSPTDSECTYNHSDVDTDGDGWSDLCDAFADDSSEWIDLDADNCGHNIDIDDLNASESSACVYEDLGNSDNNETDSDNNQSNDDNDSDDTPAPSTHHGHRHKIISSSFSRTRAPEYVNETINETINETVNKTHQDSQANETGNQTQEETSQPETAPEDATEKKESAVIIPPPVRTVPPATPPVFPWWLYVMATGLTLLLIKQLPLYKKEVEGGDLITQVKNFLF